MKEYEDHGHQIVLGAGEVYIARTGAPGERYVGDTPGASLSVELEETTIFASDGPQTDRRLLDIQKPRRTFNVTLQDISAANVALWLSGTESTTPGSAVSDELYPAVAVGYWYQFGGGAGVPAVAASAAVSGKAGKSGSSAISHIDPVGSIQSDTEIAVDYEKGRFKVLKKTALGKDADSGPIRLSYTPVARSRVVSGIDAVYGAVRYLERAATAGASGRNVYIPRARIVASGQWELKSREQPQRMELSCEVDGEIYIDAVAA